MGGSDNLIKLVPTANEVVTSFLETLDSLTSLSDNLTQLVPRCEISYGVKSCGDQCEKYPKCDHIPMNAYRFASNNLNYTTYTTLEQLKLSLSYWLKSENEDLKLSPLISQGGMGVITKISLTKFEGHYKYLVDVITMENIIKQISSNIENNNIKLNAVLSHISQHQTICKFLKEQTHLMHSMHFEFVYRWTNTLMTLDNYKKLTNIDECMSFVDLCDRFEIVQHENNTLYIEKFNHLHIAHDYNKPITRLGMIEFFKDTNENELIPMCGVQWVKLVVDDSGEKCNIVDSTPNDKNSFINIIPATTKSVHDPSFNYHWSAKELYNSCTNFLCNTIDAIDTIDAIGKCKDKVQICYDGYPFVVERDSSGKIIWKFSPTSITQFSPASIEKRLVKILVKEKSDLSKIVHQIHHLCNDPSFSLLGQTINLFTDSNEIMTETEFQENHRLLSLKFKKGSYKPELIKFNDIDCDSIRVYKFSPKDPLPVQTLTEFLNDLKNFKLLNNFELSDFTSVFSLGRVTFDFDDFIQKEIYPLNFGVFPFKMENLPSDPFNFITLVSASEITLKSPPVFLSTMIQWLTPIAEKYPDLWVTFDCRIFDLHVDDFGTLSYVKDLQTFINSGVNRFPQMMASLSELFDPNVEQIVKIVQDNFCSSVISRLTLVVFGSTKTVGSIKNLTASQIKFLHNHLYYEYHQLGPISIYLGKNVKQIFTNSLIPEARTPPQPHFCFTVETLNQLLQSYDCDDYVLLNSSTMTRKTMTFDGPVDTSFGPNVIDYQECKLTEINTVGQIKKFLTSIRDGTKSNQPVLCNEKPFYLIQRSLDGKAFLIPFYEQGTRTIAKSCLNPLTRLNELANETDDGDLLTKLDQEVSKFNHSLFTQSIQIIKIHKDYYTMDDFVNNIAPVMKDPKCLKIFKSACNKKVHSSSYHYFKMYSFIGRNPEALISVYQRLTPK